MSHRPRHTFQIEGISGRLFGLLSGDEQRNGGHDDGKLRRQVPGALDATIKPDASAARVLGFADHGIEKLGNAETVQHFGHALPLLLKEGHPSISVGSRALKFCRDVAIRASVTAQPQIVKIVDSSDRGTS